LNQRSTDVKIKKLRVIKNAESKALPEGIPAGLFLSIFINKSFVEPDQLIP